MDHQEPVAPTTAAQPAAAARRGRLMELDSSDCTIFAGNGRAQTEFDPKKNKSLIADIRHNRQQTPVLARQIDGQFEIIAGTRRLGAIRALNDQGHKVKLKAIVVDASDHDAWTIAEKENAERRNLAPMHRARSWDYAIKTIHGGRQDLFAAAVGYDPSVVSRTLALLKIPQEVLDAVENPDSLSVHFASQLSGKLANEGEAKIIRETAANIAKTMGRIRATQLLDELLSTPAEIADREPRTFDLPDSSKHAVFRRSRDGSAALSLKRVLPGSHDAKARKALLAAITSELKKFLLLDENSRSSGKSVSKGSQSVPDDTDLFGQAGS